MAPNASNPQQIPASETPSSSAGELSRTKSVATRLTEAELAEIEAAAFQAGKKVAEWLRDTALSAVRTPEEMPTDVVLLAEIIGIRNLMVNLFAQASNGPLTKEDIEKMRLYADSIKDQKAIENLAQRRLKSTSK
ncbi:plasmid mobilization protein [Terriglobus roseus]|uniref:Uncharacterized protein n=1 Tax=Terriglobus roseus TaxID=392734 RepID=A0A1G7JFZ4_9BACT|nr:hypothetical protein [Terriglobus roseus]SDF23828.1 hypothetical protein SAMN05444167_1808 [Terriglobus roseus]